MYNWNGHGLQVPTVPQQIDVQNGLKGIFYSFSCLVPQDSLALAEGVQ